MRSGVPAGVCKNTRFVFWPSLSDYGSFYMYARIIGKFTCQLVSGFRTGDLSLEPERPTARTFG